MTLVIYYINLDAGPPPGVLECCAGVFLQKPKKDKKTNLSIVIHSQIKSLLLDKKQIHLLSRQPPKLPGISGGNKARDG